MHCKFAKKFSNNASTSCNFGTTGIKEAYRLMIEEVIWNTGGVGSGTIYAPIAYEAERETVTGQICKGATYKDGAWCTDEVVRTTT